MLRALTRNLLTYLLLTYLLTYLLAVTGLTVAVILWYRGKLRRNTTGVVTALELKRTLLPNSALLKCKVGRLIVELMKTYFHISTTLHLLKIC